VELKELGNDIKVLGPDREKNKIPGLDTPVSGGECFEFGSFQAEVLDVGGHTHGHIAYHFPDQQTVFCGDALFALGCGRMFEGTPDQFWTSLKRLRNLPDETTVYW
jgi:hydroxyacylglutathione hydrolase